MSSLCLLTKPGCGQLLSGSGSLRSVPPMSYARFSTPPYPIYPIYPRCLRMLFEMSHGSHSVAEFEVEFRTAAVNNGWNGTTLYDVFYRGLAAKVKDLFTAHELPTMAYVPLASSQLMEISRHHLPPADKERCQECREAGHVANSCPAKGRAHP